MINRLRKWENLKSDLAPSPQQNLSQVLESGVSHGIMHLKPYALASHIGQVNSLNTLSTLSESLLRLMSIFMTKLFCSTKLFNVAWVHVETWNLPTSTILLISDWHTWIQLELLLFNEQAFPLLTNLALHQLVVRNFLNLATIGTKNSAHLRILSVADAMFAKNVCSLVINKTSAHHHSKPHLNTTYHDVYDHIQPPWMTLGAYKKWFQFHVVPINPTRSHRHWTILSMNSPLLGLSITTRDQQKWSWASNT